LRKALIPAALGLSLAACTPQAQDALARDRAKMVVNDVVERQFPGVNAAPVTDCIIDAASAREILAIAGASVTGVTERTAEQVLEIARRPEAVQCIAERSIALLAG
jgi:predicted ThiF/HesA family dinucleotide-utilizing enzyme